ncbi:hypothetical protein VOLCADRAFT_120325 [Volvox carteri f. nagariensis]|uniref:AMP-dependent synthetase/ligase domain-containing protein n=1 Tax=Volvox carteri f. nagariensis TaxID=3068 RepID=D8TJQ4_VOLCA|nr:uncharacterized protein VOLCADRAFT_120325 [Volvox carteri f. nagariensis]EFJ52583.1 hypothetical protein VOLCADRAFT_120325 [Volvox carteri f. nagariensis]|eukprot:XP_002946656.1 hypothetical protein VOLCADRAFT_120325 [Volvox carteri f. nagariensis]
MPMTPSAVCLYMAAVLAGCVVVSVADSFSPGELRTRLDVSGAVGVFTQDVVLRGGKVLPLYDKVIKSGTPARAVVLPAAEEDDVNTTSSPGSVPLRPGDLSWADFMKSCGGCSCSSSSSSSSSNTRSCCRGGCGAATGCTDFAEFTPHVADMYNVTNVLFSSGTTASCAHACARARGEPKAIPWSHLTPLRCAVDGWAHLDIRPGSVVCWPTNLGWMMGPWLLYAAWLNGATVALYGGAPLGPDFLQFVEAARVDVLGLVPSIVRAWRHGGAGGGRGAATDGVDLSRVRVYGSTGEASAAEDYAWLMSRARGYRPIVEYCGGTEIGGGYVSSTLMHPCAPSTFTTATLGARLVLLAAGDEGEGAGTGAAAALVWDGAPCRTAHQQSTVSGEVALAMPMLGVSQRLLNKDHYQVYYAGMPVYGSTGMPLRRHGDEMAAMPAAGPGPAAWSFCALGRCDDTMNLGGIKVSSVELERAVVAGVAGVVEAAAVGVAPPQGGPEELTLVLVVLRQQTPAAAAAPGAGSSSGSGSSSSRNGDEELQHGKQQIADLQRRCQEVLRTRLNPLFKVSRVVVVPSLPRNASNKVMRRVLRDMLLQLPGQAKL